MKFIKTIIGAILAVSVLTGCSSDQQTLQIATKPMTEQLIIGNVLKQLIEAKTDYEVELTEGVGGGTSNIQPAMESGEFDLYPEYTGTGWNAVLKEDSVYSEDMFDSLEEGYSEMDLTWLTMLGFNNTYGLAVSSEIAEEYNLETYSDLATVADKLTFGAEYDFFEREDGYAALQETYRIEFSSTTDLDIGLKYDAIAQDKVDVINIFTTDGQLSSADVVVLEDDLGLYPSYMCGLVVRDEVLETFPELAEVLDELSDSIDDSKMAEMNYLVETDGLDPIDVATDFLSETGLVN